MPSGNLPGPYEIEYTIAGYTGPARTHRHRLNVAAVGTPAIGTPPASINIQKAGGGTGTLTAVANQYWEFLRLIFPNTISCSGYTLWRYVSGTYAKTFISSGTVTNALGSGAGVAVAYQMTLSFRSANGGIMKLVYLESNQSGEARSTLVSNAAGTPPQKIAAYILSADNVALARDDAYPLNPLFDSRGQNERVWRDVFRQT